MAVLIHVLNETGNEITDQCAVIDQVIIIQNKDKMLRHIIIKIINDHIGEVIEIQVTFGRFKRRNCTLSKARELDD